MKLDYIPIYKNKIYPTKEMLFHSEGIVPKGITNIDTFRNAMIDSAIRSKYLSNCDCVIVLEEGKVIEIIKKEE